MKKSKVANKTLLILLNRGDPSGTVSSPRCTRIKTYKSLKLAIKLRIIKRSTPQRRSMKLKRE